MPFTRRDLLGWTVAGVAATTIQSPGRTQPPPPRSFKAIAFDAFPIFDAQPVFALAETLFPGKGTALSETWRIRQFEYQWLRALSGQYADFWQTTEDALVFAAKQNRLELIPENRTRLMQGYLELKAWPDVRSALVALRELGIRLAFLSNMTIRLLEAGIRNASLDGFFECVISTDRIATYEPDHRAYQMAIDALRLEREEILFVAFAGWDAAGAKWFGYPTFWVNRLALPAEELTVTPDAIGRDLTDLVAFVKASL